MEGNSSEILEYTTLTKTNTVFKVYVVWSAILLIKMILMSYLTAIQRVRKKAASSPEDTLNAKLGMKVVHDDPDVERVRRAHLNDIENILPYLLIGFFYVLTKPGKKTAIWLFSVAGSARILHTIVYAIVVIPQPARGICFNVATLIMLYMAIVVIVHFA